jgi:hypothetical protein
MVMQLNLYSTKLLHKLVQLIDHTSSARLQYVIQFLNLHFVETTFVIIRQADLNPNYPFLRYSNFPSISNELYKSGLTDETHINKNFKLVLPNQPNEIDFHQHDFFSIIFYFLSRYEEYLSFIPDKHNRFEASQHILFPSKMKRAFVDECCIQFCNYLLQLFPNIQLKQRAFTFINTIDVDNAFAFCSKSIVRNGVGVIRDIYKLKLNLLKDRFLCVSRLKKDPYLSHKNVQQLVTKPHQTHYFLLLADYAKNDRAVNTKTKAYQKMVDEMSQFAQLGWHPGYEGFTSEDKWHLEFERFKKLTGNYPIRSRQHFLRLRFPETYRALIRFGIKEDFSQGFASDTGFRAGTAHWFYFFDLIDNQQKDLKLFPFSIMEGIFKYYKKKQQFKEEAEALIDYHIQLQLPFTWLWHNDSISGYAKWKGWDTDYAAFISKINHASRN